MFAEALTRLDRVPVLTLEGQMISGLGLTLRVEGLERGVAIGDLCYAINRSGEKRLCEVIGFEGGRALVMSFTGIVGLSHGSQVQAHMMPLRTRPCRKWLGRVVDGLGNPVDLKGALPSGLVRRPFRSSPPRAFGRRPLGPRIETSVRALDTMLPLCQGQRVGIFSGSGVGKSTLMGMIAKRSDVDAIVVGLIGERGREVQDFLRRDLGEDGLERSVVVVATSDESPLMRRQAAYMTLTIAEALRDEGLHVLCLMDSVTRFAMAQREIGLVAGEPPTSKGYPPTVFSELPRLLERAGPGAEGQGDITAIFTVLVDGDDHDEPIADAVRGILDGHIVLSRRIAEQGRFPAIDILRSVSRSLPDAHSEEENAITLITRRMLSEYNLRREMIELGAYQRGASSIVDLAIEVNEDIEGVIRQDRDESSSSASAFAALMEAVKPAVAALSSASPSDPNSTATGSTVAGSTVAATSS